MKKVFKLFLQGVFSVFLIALLAANVFAQDPLIQGAVSNSSGEPLPGVTVIVKGTTNGTVTDFDGNFQLKVTGDAPMLTFSFIGMQSQDIKIAGQTTVNIVLKEDQIGLDEVVVIGYGTAKRSDLTGATSNVKGEEMVKIATSRAVEALQGKAAGVSIVKDSGRPGNSVKVRIRGIGTINNSDPLYVIDGIPSSSMDNIEANDISNIEILKDASSTAIYGSRGANGVVMVTTKSGSVTQKPVFSVNSYVSVDNLNSLDILNGYEYAEMYLEADAAEGNLLSGNRLQLLTDAVSNKTTGYDWQDEVLQTGIQQNYQFSATGGFQNDRQQNLKYYISGSYNDQQGVIQYTNFSRYNFLSKLDFKFSEKITAGLDVNYTATEKVGSNEQNIWNDPLGIALQANPLMPPVQEDGSWGDMWFNDVQRNAAFVVQDTKDFVTNGKSFRGKAWLQYEIIKGLTFKTIYNYSNSFGHTKNYSPEYYVNAVTNRSNAELYESRNESSSWYWNNLLTYKKIFAEVHDLTVMLGHEATHWENDGFNITATEGVSDVESLIYIDRATAWGNPGTQVGERGMESYFSRLSYSYKNKYILNAIVRRDGSYKFSDDNKWGTFPSLGLAWRISEEDFFNVNGMDNFKIRANWGQVGNESSAAAYAYLSTVNVKNMYYAVDGTAVTQGGIPTSTVNTNLKWETVESSNIAVDMAFLDSRLSISADYYIRKTKDMIVQVPTPDYTTNSDPFVNVGAMENKGFELTVGFGDNKGDFAYNINGNISFVNNKVTDLGSRSYIQGGRTNDKISPEYVTRTEVGEEIAYFIGYEADGIYTSQEEIDASGLANAGSISLGDVKFIDQDGSGILDSDDYIKLGSAIPDFTYGFNSNVSYKNFDFTMSIVGSHGNEIANTMTTFLGRGQNYGNLLSSRLNRYHLVNNPIGTDPRMTTQDPNENFEKFSSLLVEDGSFLKIKTLQLGYTLPETLTAKMHLQKLRVYVTGQNLITFTDYSGFDPEISEYKPGNGSNTSLAAGVDMANYPLPKSFVFGVNINF